MVTPAWTEKKVIVQIWIERKMKENVHAWTEMKMKQEKTSHTQVELRKSLENSVHAWMGMIIMVSRDLGHARTVKGVVHDWTKKLLAQI